MDVASREALAFFVCAALGSVPGRFEAPEADWAALGRYRAENARVGVPLAEKRVVFFGIHHRGLVSTAPLSSTAGLPRTRIGGRPPPDAGAFRQD